MDSLPEQQRGLIQKMSDDRLREKLAAAGMPTAAVSALSRQSLLDAWAELVATGRDKPVQAAAAAATVPIVDPELEKRRMEFEERKWADEMKIKTEKLQLERERLRLQAEAAESPAALTKKYGDALRGVLGRMPTDPSDLPAFFENAERLFASIKAPDTLHAQLLMPYLTDKARALIGRMDQKLALSYKDVKALLLREYKLTPWACVS